MLYKFYSFTDYTLDALANSSVYFSRRHQFNDPMDCDPPLLVPERGVFERKLRFCAHRMGPVDSGFVDRLLTKSATDYLFSLIDNEDFKIELQEVADLVGVFCLTNQPHHPLMWGHYSNGHKGFCVGFDIEDTELVYSVDGHSFEGQPVKIKRVDYSKKPVDCFEILVILMSLILKDSRFLNSGGKLDSKSAEMILSSDGLKKQFYNYYAMHQLSHKHSAWSYEKELRILAWPHEGMGTSGIRKLKHGRIREVIFGAKMPQSNRITLERVLNSRAIEYKQSVFSKKALDLDFLPAW